MKLFIRFDSLIPISSRACFKDYFSLTSGRIVASTAAILLDTIDIEQAKNLELELRKSLDIILYRGPDALGSCISLTAKSVRLRFPETCLSSGFVAYASTLVSSLQHISPRNANMILLRL